MATKKKALTPVQKAAAATKKFEQQKAQATAGLESAKESALNFELQAKQTSEAIKSRTTENPPVVNVAPNPTMPASNFNYQEFMQQYQNQFLDYSQVYTPPPPFKQTSAVDIAAQIMKNKGYPEELIKDTLDYLNKVVVDMGGDITNQQDVENAKQILENMYEYKTKDNTVLRSPFMARYGDYIDASKKAGFKTPLEGTAAIAYVNAIETAVKTYKANPLFTSREQILNYIKNNIDIETFNSRLAEGKAATLTADENLVESLKQQGYISGREDLINFYIGPDKAEQIFQQNKISGVIGAAALRAKKETPGMGNFDIATVQEKARQLREEGYSEEGAATVARQAYEQVQADLAPTLTASGIYETQDRTKPLGKTVEGQSLADIGRVGEIQSTLEKEQLLGTLASKQRKKKLAEMYAAGLSGSSGTAGSASLVKNIQL